MANLTGTSAAALMRAQLASRYGMTTRASTPATATTTSAMPTGKTATASGTTKGDVATISLPARRAAAQIADATKDFTALSKEVRATLNAQYKSAGKTATPKLDELSGRALAAIALNQTGGFSRIEVSAAKAALQSRERESATGAIHGGSFAAYSQTLVTQYDAMSSEERQARGWSERTRDAAATLAAQTSGTIPSLFDQMG
ncbi:hypothetical protein DC429_04565 [Arthrobacter sp. TPD3018]|uniref:hypothetical protein n=1 Tax=Bacteria TaxID=2 RepID=UPI000D507285|nr:MULTISPECIES: hypothetical protein [Bacteria]PVE59669.1 hypothetical protein DC425_04560 [Sphingomonas sp. TPD3009]PVE61185.1 hypothetical protein DC429_04565 [Arthrobacter sp. TPD3018]PVE85895.1 hypothetical protein DC431_08615 [Sphingomonas melonis]